jgi:hypothetical protein
MCLLLDHQNLERRHPLLTLPAHLLAKRSVKALPFHLCHTNDLKLVHPLHIPTIQTLKESGRYPNYRFVKERS